MNADKKATNWFKLFRFQGISWMNIAWAWSGAAVAIGLVAWMTQSLHIPLILGSFGASSVLLFGFPESPFSQPRNVVGGHVLASLVGLLFVHFVGTEWWATALATACAIAAMHITRTVHPPAGSNPVIVMTTAPAWSFLWQPTLAGAVLLVALAFVFNHWRNGIVYPKNWF